jgi:hypothetical protein
VVLVPGRSFLIAAALDEARALQAFETLAEDVRGDPLL